MPKQSLPLKRGIVMFIRSMIIPYHTYKYIVKFSVSDPYHFMRIRIRGSASVMMDPDPDSDTDPDPR